MSTAFSFLWKLKDFKVLNECKFQREEKIESPVFRPDPENRTEFCLVLDFNEYRREMSLRLKCIRVRVPSDEMLRLKSEIYVIPPLGDEKVVSKETEGGRWTLMGGESDATIATWDMQDIEDYLQNGTLTLRINLEMVGTHFSNDLNIQFDPAHNLILKNEISISKTCTTSLQVVTHRKRVVWSIDMSQLTEEGASLPVTSPYRHVPNIRVKFTAGAKKNKIVLQRFFEERIFKIICTASVVNSESEHCVRDFHVFFFHSWDLDGTPLLPPFLDLDRLTEEKYFVNTNNILYLMFDFTFVPIIETVKVHETVNCCGFDINLPKPRVSAIADFASLYETGNKADVELRCEGRTFPIHSQIVGARSRVFEAMFSTDMAEARAKSAYIPDLDAETLDNFLKYCYSNTMQPLDFAQAASLYVAADKYGVLSLRWHCSVLLMKLLAANNVCEALRFAELQEDQLLLDCCVQFVRDNVEQVLPSEDWKKLMQEKDTVALAANVMHRLLLPVPAYYTAEDLGGF